MLKVVWTFEPLSDNKFISIRLLVWFLLDILVYFSWYSCIEIWIFQIRERFVKEPAFEDITLESERKRIFKDFMHVLEVTLFYNLLKYYKICKQNDQSISEYFFILYNCSYLAWLSKYFLSVEVVQSAKSHRYGWGIVTLICRNFIFVSYFEKLSNLSISQFQGNLVLSY